MTHFRVIPAVKSSPRMMSVRSGRRGDGSLLPAIIGGTWKLAGLADLPRGMRVYLLAVIAAGVVAPMTVAATTSGELDVQWPPAAALFVLGLVAERFTLHLTHKTAINVSSAAYLAAVLLLPSSLPGAFALTVGLVGHLLRRRRDPIEALFNGAVRGLTFMVVGSAYASLREIPHTGPEIAGFGGLGVLVVTALLAHLIATMAVAGAAGFQMETNPLRIFAVTFTNDLAPEAAVAALAVQIAYLLKTAPILAPVSALPLLLVYLVIRESVRLKSDTHQALADLVEVIELRDPYTAGHSRRVAETARALALRLGLTHEEADVIESAGRVHDLGKVAIDPAVLMKPDRLTDDEFREMKRHPALGADVVARFAAYGEGWRLVRHHHERWDGKGYPDGIGGETIPLGARILAVADTYDALTSARPYREAKTSDFALGILNQGAGTQWDAEVVAALVAHLAEKQPTTLAEPPGVAAAQVA